MDQDDEGKSDNGKTDSIIERKISDFKILLANNTRKTYHGLFKDLEISRNQFLTLQLLFSSFTSILILIIFLNFEFGIRDLNVYFLSYIITGIITGLILGGVLIDKFRGKQYQMVLLLIIISFALIQIQILFFQDTPNLMSGLIGFFISLNAGMLFIFYLIFFINFTTIIERGRLFSFLFIILGLFMGIMVFFLDTILLYFLPLGIFGFSFSYIYVNKEDQEPNNTPPLGNLKKEFRFSMLKYLLIFTGFGLIIGLIFPIVDLNYILNFEFTEIQITFFVIFGYTFSSLMAAILGMIFDFFGRRSSISFIILAISIITFINIFIELNPIFNLSISVTAFLSIFIAIPLLISDISYRKNMGKILGITYSFSIISVIIGFLIKTYILRANLNNFTISLFSNGIVNLTAIISMFILVNIKETITPKEQNWVSNLIHLYIIHKSGLLLYEYSFKEENIPNSDLVGGGFIGLIALLEEITQESQKLRIIDHGGKKILFGYSKNKNLVFALILNEELRIIRNKLYYFIQEISEKYSDAIEDLTGVDDKLWKGRIDPYLKKYFKRKYFEMIPLYKT
ncbi:MAG: hypothetical protein GF317_22595 [Candidatus Lokiarchaeota archaeon]|nr:hypothetical protein [Candidatus Lokiarchaeota archaeon]MBD3202251.1 hypothetical protein [Candidatus Lokiarchaeota archaeon]